MKSPLQEVLNIIFICIIFSYQAIAFTFDDVGSIRGSVINRSSGEQMTNAKLLLMSKNKVIQQITSNSDGTFIFPEVRANVYDLVCEYPGFVKQKMIGLEIREDHAKLAFFKMNYGEGEDLLMTHASLQIRREKGTAEKSKTNMYVYTEEQIQERGYMHLSEFLQDLPQVEVNERSSFTNYNTVSSRGITGNEKLLILINGVRISSMARTSHALDKAFPIKYAKRIEVILGPSSSSYEEDAFVGVINIVMPDGRKQTGGAVSGAYGMYHSSENAFIASFGKEQIGGSISGHFYNSQDPNLAEYSPEDFVWYQTRYKKNGNVLNNVFGNDETKLPTQEYSTPQQAFSLLGTFNYKNIELGFAYNSQSFSSATGVNSAYGVAAKENTAGFGLGNAYAKHILKSYKGKKIPKRNYWTLESQFNWNHYHQNKNGITQNIYTNYQKAYRYAYDNNFRLRETFKYNLTSPNKKFKHQIGFYPSLTYTDALPITSYLEKEFTKGNAVEQGQFYIGSDAIDEDGNSLKFAQSFFFTKQLDMSIPLKYKLEYKDLITVQLGARYSRLFRLSTDDTPNKTGANDQLSSLISVIVKPSKFFRIKVFFSGSFLTPSLSRRYEHYGTLEPVESNSGSISLEGQSWRIPNDSLNLPESARSIEADFSYSKSNFFAYINGYVTFGENIIRDQRLYNESFFENRIMAQSAVKVINSGSSILYGATAFCSYEFSLGKEDQFTLKADGSYTYADGKVEGLDHVPYTAKHTLKGGLLLRYKFLSLSTRLVYRSVSYNEGYEDEDGNFLQYANEGFVVLNLYAKGTIYENKKSGLAIDVFTKVYNLGNNQYHHVTENNPISTGASVQAPITILGGFNFRFMR